MEGISLTTIVIGVLIFKKFFTTEQKEEMRKHTSEMVVDTTAVISKEVKDLLK